MLRFLSRYDIYGKTCGVISDSSTAWQPHALHLDNNCWNGAVLQAFLLIFLTGWFCTSLSLIHLPVCLVCTALGCSPPHAAACRRRTLAKHVPVGPLIRQSLPPHSTAQPSATAQHSPQPLLFHHQQPPPPLYLRLSWLGYAAGGLHRQPRIVRLHLHGWQRPLPFLRLLPPWLQGADSIHVRPEACHLLRGLPRRPRVDPGLGFCLVLCGETSHAPFPICNNNCPPPP